MDINNIQSIGQFAAFVTLLTWMSREDRSILRAHSSVAVGGFTCLIDCSRLHYWYDTGTQTASVISYVICTIVDDHPGCEGKSIGIVYLLHTQIFYIIILGAKAQAIGHLIPAIHSPDWTQQSMDMAEEKKWMELFSWLGYMWGYYVGSCIRSAQRALN